MTCTCAGTAPGYPQHESYCGQPEEDETPTAEDIAEERLKAHDYEAWANL